MQGPDQSLDSASRGVVVQATVAAATAIPSSYGSLVQGQILAASYYPAETETVTGIAADDPGDALDAADAAVVQFAHKVALKEDKITQEWRVGLPLSLDPPANPRRSFPV